MSFKYILLQKFSINHVLSSETLPFILIDFTLSLSKIIISESKSNNSLSSISIKSSESSIKISGSMGFLGTSFIFIVKSFLVLLSFGSEYFCF